MRPSCSPRLALAALSLGLLAPTACDAESDVGPPRLVDRSDALDRAARARIERYLTFVRAERGIDYRVVLPEPELHGSPEAEAERWFRELEVGRDADGRGLLLWLDAERRLARVEVGYSLEGIVPDLSAAWIVGEYLAPHARGDDLAAGIEASIEGLIDRVAPRRAELADAAAAPGSGGGGARADLGRDPDEGPARDLELAPQGDPRAVRDLELAMMSAGRYDATAPIYDEAWRRTRSRRRWSPERLRQIARRFDRPYEIASDGDHAVAYHLDAPDLGPTLLRREAGGWIIDATAGARLVVYDYANTSWYLVDEPSPYVELLRGVYPMVPGRLQDGRRAWWIRDAGE